jgi:hypothetical protein
MQSRTLGLATLAAVALALSAAAMLLAADQADAQLVTEVVVEVKPSTEQQKASVTDLTSDNVTFELTVTVTRPFPFTPITVTPAGAVSGATGWEVVFTPFNAKFNGSGSADFTANVIVPANLSAGRIYTVNFNTSVEGVLLYNTVPDNGLVEILPYYKIGRTFSTEARTLKQGGSGTFNFTVTNRGNSDDTIVVALEDEAGLQLRGITVQYPRTQRLEPWQSAVVQFFVDVANDAQPGTAQINFTLKSQGSGEKVTSSAQFTLQVEEAVLRGLLFNYWWAIVLLVVVIVVVAYLVARRRRHRREDEEALEYLKRKEARRQSAPAGKKAVAGRGASGAPAAKDEDAGPEADEGEQSTDEGTDDGTAPEEAVEVEVGTEVEES